MVSYSRQKKAIENIDKHIFSYDEHIKRPTVAAQENAAITTYICDVGNILLAQKGKFFYDVITYALSNYGGANKWKYINYNVPFITRKGNKFFVYTDFYISLDGKSGALTNAITHKKVMDVETQKGLFTYTLSRYSKDLQVSERSKRWEDRSATLKTLRKKREISLRDYVTTHLMCTPDFKSLDSKTKSDISGNYEDRFVAPELNIAYEPEDLAFMYDKGPNSCVCSWSQTAKESWLPEYKRNKIHPAFFYAVCPYIVGAYIKAGDKVTARTMLYKNEKMEVVARGRIYGLDGNYKEKLSKAIKEHFHKSLPELGDEEYEFPAPWETQGFEFEGVRYLPIPYTDNLYLPRPDAKSPVGMYFKYDPNNRKFTVWNKNIKGMEPDLIHDTRSHKAWLTETDFNYAKQCSVCERKIRLDRAGRRMKILASLDGKFLFCCEGCMKAKNYDQAYNSAGEVVIVPSRSLVSDYYAGNRDVLNERDICSFTTLDAAYRNGAQAVLSLDEVRKFSKALETKIAMQQYEDFTRHGGYYYITPSGYRVYIKNSFGPDNVPVDLRSKFRNDGRAYVIPYAE